MKKILSCMLIIWILGGMVPTIEVKAASNVIAVEMEMYSTSGTPVYTTDNIFTDVAFLLERFTLVKVTGITTSGFYRVDIGGTYYIPGAFLIAQVSAPKTEKEIMLEALEERAEAYAMLLEQSQQSITTYGLVDVTGDGLPELFSGNGREIYTCYEGRPVVMYCGMYQDIFYKSPKDNALIGKYSWNGQDIWEVFYVDMSLLPWGQFRCFSTLAAPYIDKAVQITYPYTNDEATRTGIKTVLKNMLGIS
ncbi:MAG: hypothetical protein E7290_05945 [Lachnospiraceae bacterium]|nr:hypothetical protein [Lachnospiraceae bacterium]